MSLNKNLTAQSIRYFRKKHKLSQQDLCGKQLSIKTLQLIENGTHTPRIDNLIHFSKKLKVPLNHLVFFDEYLLYEEFSKLKIDVFNFFNTKNMPKLQQLDVLIQKLLAHSVSFELEHELKLHRLYIAYCYLRIDNLPLSRDFTGTLESCLSTHLLSSEFSNTDIIIVTLFFTFIVVPTRHPFFNNISHNGYFHKSGRALYHTNIFWLEEKNWTNIIHYTSLYMNEIDMNTTVITSIFLNLQLAIAHHHNQDNILSSEYYNKSKQLLAIYDNDRITRHFNELSADYLQLLENR